jgi:hypothetical protein
MIRIKDLLETKILIPRYTPEERVKARLLSAKKSIEQCKERPCRGDLDLSNVEIEELPDNLKVQDTLNLMNTKISVLPDNLAVGGSLILYGLWNLRTIPGTVNIGKTLNMNSTGVRSIEKGLQLAGNLYARNTYLTTLPSGMAVAGDVDLVGSKIEALPRDLKVGGKIDLTNTPLSNKLSVEQIKQLIPGIKGEIQT